MELDGGEKGIAYYNRLAVQAREDEQSFSELYEHFFPRVYNFIFARVKAVSTADEIVSITFEKMLQHMHEYHMEKAAFSTWLFRIADNTIKDFFRQEKKFRVSEWDDFFADAADEHPTPEMAVIAKETNYEESSTF